jgi:hypothetical protein
MNDFANLVGWGVLMDKRNRGSRKESIVGDTTPSKIV